MNHRQVAISFSAKDEKDTNFRGGGFDREGHCDRQDIGWLRGVGWVSSHSLGIN
jgi:hypothetical protein